MEKTKECDRCGWPLEPSAVRGGLTRHPGCGRPAEDDDGDMLPLTPTTDPTATKGTP